MENIKKLKICNCSQISIEEAVNIFQNTTLPYKKARKLVTKCNKTCCRRPLRSLFNMIEFGFIDYEEIAFLINQKNDRLKENL